MNYQSDQNLENITQSKSSFLGRAARNIGTYLALTAATITGCNAPGYHAPSAADREAQAKYEKWEKGAEPEQFSKDLLAAIDSKEPVKVYEASKTLDKDAQKVFKKLEGDEFTEAVTTYSEIKKQNDQLNTLFSSAKIHRYVVHNIRQNADADVLEKYDNVGQEDANKIVDSLSQINASLKTVSYSQRQKLKKMLNGVKGADELLSYNQKSLESLNKFCNMIADAASLERKIETVVESYILSANITKSTQGISQLDFEVSGNRVPGEGRKILDKLLEEKISDVCSPNSMVAQNYGKDGNKKLKEVYAEIMNSAWERSKKQKYDTLHKITQNELSSALNIGFEAYRHNVITEAQLQSISRVITKDFLDKIVSSPKTVGVDFLNDVLLPVLPLYNIASVFIWGPDAFSHETASADSKETHKTLSELLTEGNGVKIGAWNNRNFVGDKSPAVATVLAGGISFIIEAAATGITVYYVTKPSGGSGSGSGATGTPPVGGGGGTTGGIK